MNPFESGERKNIPAVLIYVRHQGQTLMIHRNTRDLSQDDHAGKWNGLGGKCEINESYLEAAKRELEEESGLVFALDRFRFLGFLQFPNFKAQKNEDWSVMVFTVEAQASELGTLVLKSKEGTLHWIEDSKLSSLPLWAGDRHFIDHVRDSRPFFGSITYEGPEVIRARVDLIE